MCKSHAVYGLTSVSAVYSADSSVQQIAAPLLSFLVYYQTDADLRWEGFDFRAEAKKAQP